MANYEIKELISLGNKSLPYIKNQVTIDRCTRKPFPIYVSNFYVQNQTQSYDSRFMKLIIIFLILNQILMTKKNVNCYRGF